MPSESILIVDDNLTNLGLVRLLLKDAGYEVHAAAGLKQALEMLKNFHPHMILMDSQLAGMDRLELPRRLKSDRATRDIIVAALNASPIKEAEQKALDAGCDGFIAKPVDTRALPGLVRQFLEDAERKNPGLRRAKQPPTESKR